MILYTMEQEVKNFERDLILQSSLKPITIQAHLSCITRIFRILKTTNPTAHQIEDYVLELKQSSYSCSHISNNIVTIEKYSSSCGRKIRFARPKKPKRLIKDFLSEAEVSKIISACKNIREKAFLAILAFSGLRNQELCNLKVSDIDLGNNHIKVFNGKGSKDGISNISGECSKILINYLNKFQREDDDYLFTTLKRGNQYTTSDLRKLVKVVSKRAGIKKRTFPHLLRISLATNLLKRGANITTIQKQLRHTFISTTEIYLRSFPERIKTEYDFYTPAYI